MLGATVATTTSMVGDTPGISVVCVGIGERVVRAGVGAADSVCEIGELVAAEGDNGAPV